MRWVEKRENGLGYLVGFLKMRTRGSLPGSRDMIDWGLFTCVHLSKTA